MRRDTNGNVSFCVQLKEYCDKTEYYIPRANELCLALYQGGWYRALCINPRLSRTTCNIFFVDYGNMEPVEHKDIRMMSKDFIKPDAIANMCTVVSKYSSNVRETNLPFYSGTETYTSCLLQISRLSIAPATIRPR